jgi:hypothetical protein
MSILVEAGLQKEAMAQPPLLKSYEHSDHVDPSLPSNMESDEEDGFPHSKGLQKEASFRSSISDVDTCSRSSFGESVTLESKINVFFQEEGELHQEQLWRVGDAGIPQQQQQLEQQAQEPKSPSCPPAAVITMYFDYFGSEGVLSGNCTGEEVPRSSPPVLCKGCEGIIINTDRKEDVSNECCHECTQRQFKPQFRFEYFSSGEVNKESHHRRRSSGVRWGGRPLLSPVIEGAEMEMRPERRACTQRRDHSRSTSAPISTTLWNIFSRNPFSTAIATAPSTRRVSAVTRGESVNDRLANLKKKATHWEKDNAIAILELERRQTT